MLRIIAKFVLILQLILLLSVSVFAVGFDEILQGAVDLIVENHPQLISQRQVIGLSEGFELPSTQIPLSINISGDLGTKLVADQLRIVPLIGVSASYPILDPQKGQDEVQKEYALRREVEKDKQQLQLMKERIIDNFVADLNKIIEVAHQVKGQKQLVELLNQRKTELEGLINLGLTEPALLWDLDERLIFAEVEKLNLESQLTLLVSRISNIYGGEQREQLAELVEQIIKKREVANNNE